MFVFTIWDALSIAIIGIGIIVFCILILFGKVAELGKRLGEKSKRKGGAK